jgi:hypothetical protein
MTKELQKVARGSRPKRTPIDQRGKLSVSNKDPEREYRFVNDKDGRVEMFEANGWEKALASEHQVGDRRADGASALGSAARYPVGLGDSAVLMSIPKEWYMEDQKDKQRVVDASEQTIKATVSQGHKGSLELSRGS